MRHRHYTPTPAAVLHGHAQDPLPEAPAPARPRPQVYLRHALDRPVLRRLPTHLPGRRLRRGAPTRRATPPSTMPCRPRRPAWTNCNDASIAPLQGHLPKALRRQRQPLAIDLTLIPYHGPLPLHHTDEVYRSQAKKSGTSRFTLTPPAARHPQGPAFHRGPDQREPERTASGSDPSVAPARQRHAGDATAVFAAAGSGFCGVAVESATCRRPGTPT